MKGHIYRRNRADGGQGRWHAVIDLPARADGRRRQQTSTHDTKREAQAWLANISQELRAGEVYDSTLSVKQFLTEWLAGKQSLRPTTTLEYQRHISQVFIPQLGHLRLLDLRAHHIEAVFQRLAAGNPRRERPITPQTMRRILATLNSALNTATRRGLIRRNPAATVELPRASPAAVTVWTRDEAGIFLRSTVEDPLHLMYRLLILTGLRRGEAVGLQWGDLDLDAGTVSINRQVVAVGTSLVVGPPKSDAGRRSVVLDTTTAEQLRLRQRRARIQQPWQAAESFDGLYVFARADGSCYDPAYVSRHFKALAARLGLPPIRLHDLRHTSASLGLEGGETLLEVSRRLGHSAIAITADVYAHVSTTSAKASAQRLAELMDGQA